MIYFVITRIGIGRRIGIVRRKAKTLLSSRLPRVIRGFIFHSDTLMSLLSLALGDGFWARCELGIPSDGPEEDFGLATVIAR